MNKTLKVLLVEDHEADQRLVEEALRDCNVDVELKALCDGEQAVKYIKKVGAHKKAESPDLIILDLNMPRKDGHEFLDEVHELLKAEEIPVILLTVSDNPEDLRRALDRRMNFYLSKPVNAEKLQEVLAAVSMLWSTESCCQHN